MLSFSLLQSAKKKKGRTPSKTSEDRPVHVLPKAEKDKAWSYLGRDQIIDPRHREAEGGRSLCKNGFAEGPLYPLRRGVFKSAREGNPSAAWERGQTPPSYIARCLGAMRGRRRYGGVRNDGCPSPTHARPRNTRRRLARWILQPSRSGRRPERRPAATRRNIQCPRIRMDGRPLPHPLCEIATTGTRGRRDPRGLPRSG